MQMQDIRAKIKRYSPEIITTAYVALGCIATVYLVKTANKNSNLQTEPDRLAGPNHIVLEHVEGEKNLWVDMDEPVNFYRLEGARDPSEVA